MLALKKCKKCQPGTKLNQHRSSSTAGWPLDQGHRGGTFCRCPGRLSAYLGPDCQWATAWKDSETEDHFVWRWTADGKYTTQSSYKMLYQGSIPFQGTKLIWKTRDPGKVKLFLWTATCRRGLWIGCTVLIWNPTLPASCSTKKTRHVTTLWSHVPFHSKSGERSSLTSGSSALLQWNDRRSVPTPNNVALKP
jgi:hypothetical protein